MEYIWQSINQFAVTHDTRKIFLIIYIGGAAAIALLCGLFYFAVWVAAHFILELYKSYRISSKIRLKDIGLSFYHCRLDFMFLTIGLCVDLVAHHSLALATTTQEIRILTFLRISRIESLGRIAKVARVMPRLFGTIKASSCVLHLSDELSRKAQHHQAQTIDWKVSDTIIFCAMALSLALTFIIPMSMGIDFWPIMHTIVEILSP